MPGGFPGGSVVKNPPANAGDRGDVGSIPGLGRFPGVENSNPLRYSCLKNPMNRGASRTTVLGVTKSWAQLSPHAHSTPSSRHLLTIAQLIPDAQAIALHSIL